MRKRLGFLGLLASLIIVFFSNSSFAAGYSCTKTYLSCKPGYYLSGENCLVCRAGKYCTGGTTAPQNCPAGTYRNTTGGTSSSSCTACAVGSYSSAGASSCRACQDGKTTSGTGKTSCDTSCSNVSGASTWADATWTANTVTNKCAISTCSTGYTKGGSANSSGASSYTCSANCNKITLNNTTRGGSGGTTAVYKKTGSATWYSNSNCSTSITSVTKPSKTNATYAGTYTTNASSGGTQCITSSGALSTSSSCNVSSAATWYARYTCNTNYTGSGTNITGACTASPITITLNKNGGTGTSGGATGTTSGTITCYYNTACTLPSWNSSTNNITNGNKIFKGWATTSTATSGSTSMTFTAADTLYAVWVTPTCSVTNGSGTITTPSSNAPRCSVTCDSGYSQSGGTNTTTSFTATGSAGGTSVSTSCKARSYSCSEGKYLNGVTCTTCTANYYCGGGTWTYNGGVQGRSTCSGGTGGLYTKSAAGTSSVNSCYLTTTKGKFVKTAKAGEETCTAGGYCPGGVTVYYNTGTTTGGRTACSTLANGFYPNSAAGSDAANDCYTNSLSGKYVASKNASSATRCDPGYFKGAHTVNYGSTSSCSACTGATYADVEGLASCKTCPTATTYKDRVTSYWYWTEDGIQDSKYGCRASITVSASAHGTYTMSCALSSSNEDYGIGGGSTQCMASSISKCSSGYYAPNGSSSVWKSSINNLEASVCVPAGTGYFSGDGSLTRTACTSVYENTTTTTTTASSSSSCVCKAGYGGTSASSCNACAKGTYKSSAGTVACSSAGSGYYVDTTAATSRKSCTSLGAIYTASDSGYDASTDCYATTSTGKWLASAKATAFSTCSAGDYCPGSIKVYYNSTGGKKDCPSGYPNSAAGSSLITQCYSNTKSRAWTGSQVNGSTPTNCYSVTAWNSCSKPACDYVAYSNSAGTGDGTIKSGCSSNSANCTKTADTTTGKSGYYGYSGGNGQACSSCSSFSSSYPSSDNGAANSNYCYATKTKYGSQVNGAVPTNCYSVTSWNSCSPGSCTYRDYYGVSDTTCTPSNCTKSPAAVTAKSGYYVSGVTCPACSGLASGFYPNSNNGNTGGASVCYTNSLSGKYVASKNASSAKTCPNWTYKGSHTVKYGSVSSCSSCPALTSGWSKKDSSGTGWTSYTSCVQVSPTPSNCSSGNLKQTATSSTTWGSSSVNTALSATPKYYVNGTSCSACPAGSYCSGGTAAATKCAIGSYSTGTASACTVCGAGKTTSSTGTTGSSSCISCSSISGLSSWATPSWKANSVSNLCTVSTCSANYYKSGNSCPTCSSGTDGLYTKSAAGTTSVNSCYLTTTKGKFVKTAKAGEVTCAAGGWCPGGITIYYNTGTTTGGRTACSSLGTGYTNTSTGQSKNTSCYLPVTAGKVRVGTSGTSLDTCDAGTYKAAHNAYYGTSYSCSVCDTNKYSDAGAASCTSCDTADGYGNSGTSASSHAGVSSCKVTCDAGEYVATAGGGCVSVGSGYYTSASKTVAQNATSSRSACSSLTGVSVSGGTYSSVSPYNASSTCRYKGPSKTISGCNTVTTNTVAYSGSAWPATTYSVSANAGYYISSNNTASATCSQCTSGYYCPGGTTTRQSCSSLADGFYPNSAAGSDGASDCYTNSLSGKYVASKNASSATNCKPGYFKGAHTVKYGAISSCSACTGATYSAAGASSCTSCPTATKYKDRVTEYWYWAEDDIQDSKYGCRAYIEEDDPNGEYIVSCGLSSTDDDYGVTGSASQCMAHRIDSCVGGYYSPNGTTARASSIEDMKTKACVSVGIGYYSLEDSLERVVCDAGLTTIGFGPGADEPADCGRVLNIGDEKIYLRSEKKTTPSLNVSINGDIFYGNMGTSGKGSLKIKSGSTTYSVYDDSM